jgi:hypothetical protein
VTAHERTLAQAARSAGSGRSTTPIAIPGIRTVAPARGRPGVLAHGPVTREQTDVIERESADVLPDAAVERKRNDSTLQ